MKSLAKTLTVGISLSIMGAASPCLAGSGASASFSSAPGQLTSTYNYSSPGVSAITTIAVGGQTSVSVSQSSKVNISGVVQVSSKGSSASVVQHGQYNYSQIMQFGNIYADSIPIQY